MNRLLSLFILFSLISCNKSDHYEIRGTIQNVPDSTILYLVEISGNTGTSIASDTIVDGKFDFIGTLSNRPSQMTLFIPDTKNFSGSCPIWLDHSKIKISGNGKYLSTWIVTSKIPEQKITNIFFERTVDLLKENDSLALLRMSDPTNMELQVSILKRKKSISEEIHKIEFEILQNNYNSLSSLNKLYYIVKSSSIDKNEIIKVFNKMDNKYKDTLLGEGILAELNKNDPPKIGDRMIDVEIYDLEGKKFKLSDFSGKYILLDFWSLGCYPCILAAPELREVYKDYKSTLSIIGINMDVNHKMWLDATKRDSVTWINLSDGKGTYAGVSALYGIKGLPTYILINPKDTIIERWEGFGKGTIIEKLKSHLTFD